MRRRRGSQPVMLAEASLAFPGATIALTVLGFNLLRYALRDALDPRLRNENG